MGKVISPKMSLYTWYHNYGVVQGINSFSCQRYPSTNKRHRYCQDTVDTITATQCSCFTLCSSSCQFLHLDSTELVVSSSFWCGKWALAKTIFAESFISGKVQMSTPGAQQATCDRKHLASYSASGHKSLVSVFRIIAKCQELTYLRCQHFFLTCGHYYDILHPHVVYPMHTHKHILKLLKGHLNLSSITIFLQANRGTYDLH